jgi:glutamine amidotransferase
MIGIIDYGCGNLKSVKNALNYLGICSKIVKKPEEIEECEKIILPGVGSFGFAMQSLRKKRLEKPIKDAIKKGIPFLGICLGLQILFEKSEESPGIKGLNILKGKVIKFKNGKVPQIGWNKITPKRLFKPGYCYFVNSYYIIPEDKSIISATTNYFGKFTSIITYKNITATQFHPEKSGKFGLEILMRWLKP